MLNNNQRGLMARVYKSPHIKNIITLARGTAFAQIIGFVASPLLTRIYSPHQLGVYTLVLTLVNLIAPVACGKYEIGIVIANDEEEERALIKGSLIILLVITAVLSIVMILLYNFRRDIFGSAGAYYFLAIPSIILLAFINLLNSVNNRRGEYKIITSFQIVRTSVLSIVQVVVGAVGGGMFGLLGGQILSNLSGIIRQVKSTRLDYKVVIKTENAKVRSVLKKYIMNPLYSVPTVFVNVFSYSSINFCISALYSSSDLGYYSLSYRVLTLPIELIAQNISRVYFQRASEEYRLNNNCLQAYKSTFISVLGLGIMVGVIGWFFSESLFEFVFGAGWGKAGLFVKYMMPLMVVRVIAVSTGATLIIFKKQHIDLLIQCILFILTIIMYVIASKTNIRIELFIIYLSSAQVLVYVFSLLYSYTLNLSGKR